jgi:tol-pal system protein YbgF
MKRIPNRISIVVLVLIASCLVFGQGLRLNQPDEVGGSFVATHQDELAKSSSAGPGIEAFLRYRVSPKFLLSLGTGYYTIMDNTLSTDVFKSTLFPNLEIKGIFMSQQKGKPAPFAFLGAHAFGSKWSAEILGETVTSDKTYFDASLLVGAGLQVPMNENVSFHVSGDYQVVVTSDADPKPKFWTARAGLTYALSSARRGGAPKGEEIEYPVGDQEIADIGELFKEDTGSGSEDDALSLLFSQPEDASGLGEEGSIAGAEESAADLFSEEEAGGITESTSEYPDTEIGRLMQRVDELKTEIGSKSQQIDALQAKVDAIETQGGFAMGGPALSDSEFKTRYAEALDQFHARRYDKSIPAFQSLAASNPNHILASNCHYWTGESYNAMRDYRKALASFATVLTYKNSYKFDDALIMSGLCYMKLGETNNARTQFQELVSRYPQSEYAPKAMRYLGSL